MSRHFNRRPKFYARRNPSKKILPKTGEELRHWRVAHGLSQAELAKRLQVRQPDISRWERGVLLPTKALAKLSKFSKLINKCPRPPLEWPPQTGLQLRNYRKAHGITQEDLAKHLGMHQPQISALENGGEIPEDLKILRLRRFQRNPWPKSRYYRQSNRGCRLRRRNSTPEPNLYFSECPKCYLPITGRQLNQMCLHWNKDHGITTEEMARKVNITETSLKQYFYRKKISSRIVRAMRELGLKTIEEVGREEVKQAWQGGRIKAMDIETGEDLRRWLGERGFSFSQLGKMVGVTQPRVSQAIKSGKIPTRWKQAISSLDDIDAQSRRHKKRPHRSLQRRSK